MLSALGLFVLTALAEIAGCYGVFVFIRQGRSAWWLVPAALSLALFAWLLTLHPTASGRVYAAYGGIYVTVSLLWLWQVDGEALTRSDAIGAAVVLVGAGIIVWGGWRT